jgi:HK97 family phage major capsid protein
MALVDAQKAVSIGTPAAGGHAVPEEISRQIDKKILVMSPMRNLVKVVQVGTSDWKELVDVHGGAGGWVGETDTRSETGTPGLEQVTPTMGIVYAYPKATEESLQDIFFNVQQWLIDEASEQIAKLEGAAIISGDGSNKPTGFLDGTPVAQGDDNIDSPLRPFGILQYVPTGIAAAFPNDRQGSPQGNPVDVLIDTEYQLKAGHRANAQWLMNKGTLNVARKWKDADAQYIWTRSMVLGQPSMINGYPVTEMEDMPAIAANAFPVAFGDFKQGYVLVDRAGFSITVDDNITTPGYVKFYVRRRVGGILRNDDCIKLIKCATS